MRKCDKCRGRGTQPHPDGVPTSIRCRWCHGTGKSRARNKLGIAICLLVASAIGYAFGFVFVASADDTGTLPTLPTSIDFMSLDEIEFTVYNHYLDAVTGDFHPSYIANETTFVIQSGDDGDHNYYFASIDNREECIDHLDQACRAVGCDRVDRESVRYRTHRYANISFRSCSGDCTLCRDGNVRIIKMSR